MRNEGYYWVRDVDEWLIAWWESGLFYLPCYDLSCDEDSFDEIDEKQILRCDYD